jgi:hypothetical protein
MRYQQLSAGSALSMSVSLIACPRQTIMLSRLVFLALMAVAGVHVQAQTPATSTAPICVHDESVKERFLPVELLTGNPWPAGQVLTFAPVDRVYPFIDELPEGGTGRGEAALKGPVQWEGQGGTVYEVYERKAPEAHERFALTPDRTAIGHVYDQRFGNVANEGQFPVGPWQQGQKRVYSITYFVFRANRHETSQIEIEKLSCVYEGVPGAMQYGWKTTTGLSYGYIYLPGKGLVHVMTRARGR